MSERCETCRFFRARGSCHRYPTPQHKIRADWCGEWQAKAEEPAPDWDGSPVKTGPGRYKVKRSWLEASSAGRFIEVDNPYATVDILDDTPAKPAPRERGSYWVRPRGWGDWVVAQAGIQPGSWFLPGEENTAGDEHMLEIDERRIVRGG